MRKTRLKMSSGELAIVCVLIFAVSLVSSELGRLGVTVLSQHFAGPTLTTPIGDGHVTEMTPVPTTPAVVEEAEKELAPEKLEKIVEEAQGGFWRAINVQNEDVKRIVHVWKAELNEAISVFVRELTYRDQVLMASDQFLLTDEDRERVVEIGTDLGMRTSRLVLERLDAEAGQVTYID